MSSPQNPLNKLTIERTAASYLIIYLVNQLFLANNDVIELGWLEREFHLTDRTKFDGILFKASPCFHGPSFKEPPHCYKKSKIIGCCPRHIIRRAINVAEISVMN